MDRARWTVTLLMVLMVTLWLGCGETDEVDLAEGAEFAIIDVLTGRWQRGYMTEDLTLYESAYWADGFQYHADMGTPTDPSDDVIFDDLNVELDSAMAVFARYQDIEIEVTEPEIELTGDSTAIVRQHYRIEGFVTDGTSLEGGYTGWYAEGDSEFTFEQRESVDGNLEWRIASWLDAAVTPDQL